MKKVKNIGLIFGISFFLFGLVFAFVGIMMFIQDKNFKETALETNATIVDIESYRDSDGDRQYDVYVVYDVNGKKYDGILNGYSSSMDVGETVSIYYDPNNPNDFIYGSAAVGFVVFIVMGGIFGLIGLAFIISTIHKSSKRKQLRNSNIVIQANINSFDYDYSIIINNRNPFILTASAIAPYDGIMYTFKSEPMWDNLGPIFDQYNIKTVPVYVNPQNYKEYYVDIDYFKNYLSNINK